MSNSLVPLCSLSLVTLHDLRKSQMNSIPSATETELIETFESKFPTSKGTILMVHGLNLKPSAMNELALEFQERGFGVVRLSLKGHRGDRSAFDFVTFEDWLDEFKAGYCLAKQLSCRQPVFALGFSLGGLLGTYFEARYPGAFASKVLMAPALSLRALTKVLSLISWLPTLPIPSLNSSDFRANSSTPIAGYNALFSGVKKLDSMAIPSDNSTLVWADPADEVVDFMGLKAWTAQRNLGWNLQEIESLGTKGLRHHLMITKQNHSKQSWQKILDKSEEWFLLHKRDSPQRDACIGGDQK